MLCVLRLMLAAQLVRPPPSPALRLSCLASSAGPTGPTAAPPPGRYLLRFDGGSRGNPGEGGGGAVLYRVCDDAGPGKPAEKPVWQGFVYLGARVTSNEAEYGALLLGLKAAARFPMSALTVEGDSELVVNQLSGAYRVRSARLMPLHAAADERLRALRRNALVTVAHIPRERNAAADALANTAMDQRRSSE